MERGSHCQALVGISNEESHFNSILLNIMLRPGDLKLFVESLSAGHRRPVECSTCATNLGLLILSCKSRAR